MLRHPICRLLTHGRGAGISADDVRHVWRPSQLQVCEHFVTEGCQSDRHAFGSSETERNQPGNGFPFMWEPLVCPQPTVQQFELPRALVRQFAGNFSGVHSEGVTLCDKYWQEVQRNFSVRQLTRRLI